ncbi:lamin tail domain-containing protein, partial [bacterium]|nr:lamin tail domain-containing protein [bacterium]
MPRISEFLSSNVSGLKDEDGAYSDWIEIHNPDEAPIDLGGWHLTDDPALLNKWTFPSVSIPAGGYLVVFASAKDRTLSTPLHTNFKLSVDGEYLALVSPSLT